MAEIRASWRRVISVRPYETETAELTITETVDTKPVKATIQAVTAAAEVEADLVAVLFMQLAKAGDSIVERRLAAHKLESAPAKAEWAERPTDPIPGG